MIQKNPIFLRRLKILNLVSYPGVLVVMLFMSKIDNIFKSILPWFALGGIAVVGFNHWYICQALQKDHKNISGEKDRVDRNQYSKSYIKLYWLIWFILVIILICTKVLLKTLIGDQLFILFFVYAATAWLPIMGLHFFEGYRLEKYLKEYHFKKWQYLTSVGNHQIGGVNVFKFLPFFFSNDNLDDPILGDLKLNYKRFIIFVITVFFSMIPLFIFTMMY